MFAAEFLRLTAFVQTNSAGKDSRETQQVVWLRDIELHMKMHVEEGIHPMQQYLAELQGVKLQALKERNDIMAYIKPILPVGAGSEWRHYIPCMRAFECLIRLCCSRDSPVAKEGPCGLVSFGC